MATALSHLVLTLGVSLVLLVGMGRARWPLVWPGAGIVAWQLLTATAVLCVLGIPAAVGLGPYGRAMFPAAVAFAGDVVHGFPGGVRSVSVVWVGVAVGGCGAVVAAVAVTSVAVVRVRRRQRALLDLVGRSGAAAGGAWVVGHEAVVAYCVPGRRPRVVLSTGTLELLEADQLAAVLAHERAHARERHDLVVLPFAALRRLCPLRMVRRVAAEVALLVEMRADDLACRVHRPDALRGALSGFARTAEEGGRVFGRGDTPGAVLSVAGSDLAARMARIPDVDTGAGGGAGGSARRWWLPAFVVVSSAVLVATPLSLFFWPS